jgi:hypothetical protein
LTEAGELDLGFLGQGTIQYDDTSDDLHQVNVVTRVSERSSRRPRILWRSVQYFYLEKFAGVECVSSAFEDGFGDPLLADVDDRIQIVCQRTEM